MVWHQYDKNYEPKSIEEMASAGCLYKYDDFVFHYYMGGGACGMTFLVSPKNHPDMVAVMKREESEDGQVKSVFRSLCVHGEMSEFRGVTRLLGYFVEDSPLEGHFVTFTIMEAGDIDLKRALETPMYRNLEPQTQYRVLSRIYNKIAKAVAKFHERSIVHRDLKDQNVVLVLNRDDPVDLLLAEPKIVDWAFSRKTGVLQSACGTPTTQAPEAAALGQDVTTKSDVYSFGAMLFASISGTALCFHYFPHFYLYGRTFTDGQGRMLRNGDLCDQHNECRDFSAEAWWPNGDFGSHAARIVRECIRLNANHRIDVQELIRAMDNLVQVADTETVG
jgi:serine/threonine protein kinase